MQENVNLIIEEFKDSIVNTINGSNLPPAIVYYIFKDIYKDVESSYTNYLNQAKQQLAIQRREAESAAAEEETVDED